MSGTALNLQSFRRAQELPAEAWDSLARDRTGFDRSWLELIERGARDYRARYLILSDAAGPLAAATSFSWGEASLPAYARLALRAVLSISAPYSSCDSGLVFREGVSPEAGWALLDRPLRRWMRRHGYAVADVSCADADLLAALTTRRFVSLDDLPHAAIHLASADHEAYLAALPLKQRHELKRVRRRSQEQGVSFELIERVTPVAQTLFSLMAASFAKHGTVRQSMPFTPDIFQEYDRLIGPATLGVLARHAGVPVGFGLGAARGENAAIPFAGVDRERTKSMSYLYPLLMSEIVRVSQLRGVRKLHLGTTNLAQKGRVGFSALPRWRSYGTSVSAVRPLLQFARPYVERLTGSSVAG